MKSPEVREEFDALWAIDWSGARAGYRTIAVARLRRGRRVAELLSPPGGGYWTRTAVTQRLIAEICAGRRLLVGFDFAFSLPVATRARFGLACGSGMPPLWNRVDGICRNEADFYAGRFVESAPAGLFWTGGPRPTDWDDAVRLADRRAREMAGVIPESVVKLIGAKQVGRAALSGMRVLAALTRSIGHRVTVWPGHRQPGATVLVEIFPTLFRKRALGATAKIRDAEALREALAFYGVRAPALAAAAITDDATDALVSAAGMRDHARCADAFAAPADPRALDEGWIFGVPR